jgi:hypothetical protein
VDGAITFDWSVPPGSGTTGQKQGKNKQVFHGIGTTVAGVIAFIVAPAAGAAERDAAAADAADAFDAATLDAAAAFWFAKYEP